MAIEQTKDILERARTLHRELSDFYQRLKDDTQRERVKMLLDYLSRHESLMDERLKEYEESAARSLLDTWYKIAPAQEIRRTMENLNLHPDMSVAEVLDIALRLDEVLIELYKQAADLAPAEDVRALFSQLWAEAQKERARMVLDVFEHAFMIDYGLKRADYIEAFFKNVNWSAAESRLR